MLLLDRNQFLFPKPNSVFCSSSVSSPIVHRPPSVFQVKKKMSLIIFSVMEQKEWIGSTEENTDEFNLISVQIVERLSRKKSERFTYLVAAVMSSLGITSMAIIASVYYRFYWQMEGEEVTVLKMFGIFAPVVGAVVSIIFSFSVTKTQLK